MSFGGNFLQSDDDQGDLFVARFDAQGNHVWSRAFGGAPSLQYGTGLALDSAGNVVVSAVTYGPIDFGGGPEGGPDYSSVVFKLDSTGGLAWSRVHGSSVGGASGAEDVVVD